jgi:hypothetical protein
MSFPRASRKHIRSASPPKAFWLTAGSWQRTPLAARGDAPSQSAGLDSQLRVIRVDKARRELTRRPTPVSGEGKESIVAEYGKAVFGWQKFE